MGALWMWSVACVLAAEPVPPAAEAETPDVGPSVGQQVLESGRRDVVEHRVDAVVAPWRGVGNGARRGWSGENGEGGLALALEESGAHVAASGVAVGTHVVETPLRLRLTVEDSAWAAAELRTFPAEAAQETRHAVRDGAQASQQATLTLRAEQRALRLEGAARRQVAWQAMRQDLLQGIQQGDERDAWWLAASAVRQGSAWELLTTRTARHWTLARERTATVAGAWWERTRDAAGAPGRWSRWSWGVTTEGGLGAWRATPTETARVWRHGVDRAAAVHGWLWNQGTAPARAVPGMVTHVREYLVLHGWTRGTQAAWRAAGDAWAAGDVVSAVTWSVGGVGKGIFHLGLGVMLVPGVAITGVGLSAVVLGAGYPWVAVQHAAALANAGVTLGAGGLVGATVWTLGTGATLASVGVGAVHAASTAMVGGAVTGATAAAHTALTVGGAGLGAGMLVLNPLGTFAGLAAGQLWDGARWTGRASAGLMEQGARWTWQGLAQGTRLLPWSWDVASATGATVGRSGLAWGRVPLQGALVGGATAVHTAARWGTLPAAALAHLGQGALELGGGSVFAAGATAGGTADGVAQGALAAAQTAWGTGKVLGGGAVVAAEFTGRAVNVPQHRAWAAARETETQEVLERMKQDVPQAGNVILIRVHWWGEDTGRVRFFVTRDPATGKRWYFERVVDPVTCEVSYRATRHDPITRMWTRQGWMDPRASGLWRQGCTPAKTADEPQQVASR